MKMNQLVTPFSFSGQHRIQVSAAKALYSTFSKAALILLTVFLVSACGGNKKAPVENGQPVADITRPPETIVGREEVQERNPEETVSFDEWRKRRVEELRRQQSPE